MQIGSSGERHVPPLNAKAWETLNSSPEILSTIVSGIDEQLEGVQAVFLNQAVEA
jgi:hypothetical protein